MSISSKLGKLFRKSIKEPDKKSSYHSTDIIPKCGIHHMDTTFQYPNMVNGVINNVTEIRNNIHIAFNKLGLKCVDESYIPIDEMIEFGIFSRIVREFQCKFSGNSKIQNHFTLICDREMVMYMLNEHDPLNVHIIETKPDGIVVVLYMNIKKCQGSNVQLLVQHFFCMGI